MSINAGGVRPATFGAVVAATSVPEHGLSVMRAIVVVIVTSVLSLSMIGGMWRS